MTQRIQRHPYLALFDGADPAASTAVRTSSTTPLQALYFLNDPFVHQQSKQFAARLLSEAAQDTDRIGLAYQYAFARPAQPDEVDSGRAFLAAVSQQLRASGTPNAQLHAEAWEAFTRVLFRLSEFVYID